MSGAPKVQVLPRPPFHSLLTFRMGSSKLPFTIRFNVPQSSPNSVSHTLSMKTFWSTALFLIPNLTHIWSKPVKHASFCSGSVKEVLNCLQGVFSLETTEPLLNWKSLHLSVVSALQYSVTSPRYPEAFDN